MGLSFLVITTGSQVAAMMSTTSRQRLLNSASEILFIFFSRCPDALKHMIVDHCGRATSTGTPATQMGETVEGPGLGSREGRDRGGPNVRRIASVGRFAAFYFHQVEPDRLHFRAQIKRLDLQHVMQFRHRALRHPPTRSLRTV